MSVDFSCRDQTIAGMGRVIPGKRGGIVKFIISSILRWLCQGHGYEQFDIPIGRHYHYWHGAAGNIIQGGIRAKPQEWCVTSGQEFGDGVFFPVRVVRAYGGPHRRVEYTFRKFLQQGFKKKIFW
ncbi:MAG: hypothetical protein CVU58_00045 [Deltaproteobacteria bacterium HGW-Deltaproteobacteria-16]|nr:MAG: hypothetical protein CVU58_00045 [Deltaproteobacteria bacterium HGW-Deltaproteobacteria-16]